MDDDLELEEIELSDGDNKPLPPVATPEEPPKPEKPAEEAKKEEPAPVEDPIEDFVVEDVVEDLTKPKPEVVSVTSAPTSSSTPKPPANINTETPKKEEGQSEDDAQTVVIDGKKYKEI